MDVLVTVRVALAEQRRRGVDFEHAWAAALEQVPTGRRTVNERVALEATADVWARAYNREPPAQWEAAVVGLAAEIAPGPTSRSAVEVVA